MPLNLNFPNETIELIMTESELMIGSTVAALRRIQNLTGKVRDRHGAESERGWQYDIDGAFGEMAVARWRNVYWDGTVGTISAPADVGLDWQVRSTPWHNGCLLVHDTDKDDQPFILVHSSPPRMTILGWLFGAEAKERGQWGDKHPDRPNSYGTGRPCYWVTQRQLHEMSELVTDTQLQSVSVG